MSNAVLHKNVVYRLISQQRHAGTLRTIAGVLYKANEGKTTQRKHS